jgi:cytochrome b subunit of formate dehydrogenase
VVVPACIPTSSGLGFLFPLHPRQHMLLVVFLMMAKYTMEFYSVMEKNEILSFAGKWMELENIILSEVSQAQKIKNHMFSLICRL